ncbi:MAG: TIGR02234 family membrane protein [Mycolicibacterium insubricum]|jgi:uncharacterized membrane protein (TIGR02234 family)|uniref:TIGR02234 family membrane protein n=1 Tax=Mycolicibacterium insubricum TaxID=444597 RepID=A0A1X0DGZ4_9MYCO|nr:TIGR02234 family membrane protein [Mycolicibacterium insubricum]ORA71472.1 hypothetical protein BST26_07990 [Mycolicibacterium insubricum]
MADGSVRSLRVAQLLLVAAAAALWGASRLTWVTVSTVADLGEAKTVRLDGATWAAALVPLALVLLATAVATLAVRGVLLRVLAVLVALTVAGIGYLGISQFTGADVTPRAAVLADVPVASVAEVQRSHPAAVLPLLAGVVGLAAAVLMMRVARGTAGTVGRYAAPAARRDAAARPGAAGGEVSERSLWDAIDEGHDPTVLPTDPDSGAEGR